MDVWSWGIKKAKKAKGADFQRKPSAWLILTVRGLEQEGGTLWLAGGDTAAQAAAKNWYFSGFRIS